MIEGETKRKVAYCKRRRGLLKKAIELSKMCNKRIFLFMYDPEKDSAIQYASDKEFRFGEVYKTMQRLHELKKSIDFYTNDDYEKLESLDFRTVRY